MHADLSNAALATRGELRRLLAELRRRLTTLGPVGVSPPDAASVRWCLIGPADYRLNPPVSAIAVDFDLGDFVLPLCMEDWQLLRGKRPSMAEVAAMMTERIAWAVPRREGLARRELRLRGAFERRLARLGGGVAPLWLRMEPLRFDDDPSNISSLPYQLLDVRLDRHLLWAPKGAERVHTCLEIHRHLSCISREHRVRSARLAKLLSTGSEGWIGAVALDLIEAAGRDPVEVFRRIRDATLADDRREPAEVGTNAVRANLAWRDGVLTSSFRFDGGLYCEAEGRLSLWGRGFPASIVASIVGRPLNSVVAHPALLDVRARVSRSSWSEMGINIVHPVRLVTVEDAAGRQSGVQADAGRNPEQDACPSSVTAEDPVPGQSPSPRARSARASSLNATEAARRLTRSRPSPDGLNAMAHGIATPAQSISSRNNE